jgi:peptidoglycan/xylan/chitin deacetylase (PgdA/CDA1 family)
MRRLSSFRGGGATILVYHAVSEGAPDPFGIAVAPAAFARQMEVLAREFEPMRLTDLCADLAAGEVRPRAVSVTFDDGYANNLHAALPSLEAHGVPATIFIATAQIDSRREFWWDELIRLLSGDASRRSTDRLEVTVHGETVEFQPGDLATASQEIWGKLHPLPTQDIEVAMEQIRRWAGADSPPEARETHRPLTLAELKQLGRSEMIEVGAHTRRHPRLGDQPERIQWDEICGSRSDLETWLGKPPSAFAYPYGSAGNDYTHVTVELVRRAGYEVAVSTLPLQARAGGTLLELPRYFVRKQDPSEFRQWMRGRFQSLPARMSSRLAARAARGR